MNRIAAAAAQAFSSDSSQRARFIELGAKAGRLRTRGGK